MDPDLDVWSLWEHLTWEGKPLIDGFNFAALRAIVDKHFGRECVLLKIAEGGYHKVYDVLVKGEDGLPGMSLEAVVRVASPSFPRDKLLSEVATLRYISRHSSVPVPEIYEWNATDSSESNPVEAEYMIMQKIAGISAVEKWNDLSHEKKKTIVAQIAEHLASIFSLRFSTAGSLYFSSDDISGGHGPLNSPTVDSQEYRVGPVVSSPFYRSLDGRDDDPPELHRPGWPQYVELQKLRGPFTKASDFLAHTLEALLYKCKTFPVETVSTLDREAAEEDEEDGEGDEGSIKQDPQAVHAQHEDLLRTALEAIPKAIELCRIYPGDATVCTLSTPDKPFTFWWDDFRLINILIDEETGHVNGLIDFEGTVLAPTWRAAEVPQWIPDPDGDTAGWYGGTVEEGRELWNIFHATMDAKAPEWREAYEKGLEFRELAGRAEMMGLHVWGEGSMLEWVEERLEWARGEGRNGVPMPEQDDEETEH